MSSFRGTETFGGTLNLDANTLVVDAKNSRVGIGTDTPLQALDVRGNIVIDTNTLTVDSTNNRVGVGTTTPGWNLDMVKDTTNVLGIRSYGTGVAPYIIFHRGQGTAAAPSAVLANDNIAIIAARPYGATAFTTTNRASINMTAAENWTDTAQGTAMSFYTTTLGTTTTAERMRIDNAGKITMPAQPAFTATGTGTQAFAGAAVFTKLTMATAGANIGSHYNTSLSRFVAPVAGTYWFFGTAATTTATSSGPALLFFKNGANNGEISINYSNVNYTQFGGGAIYTLAANDYIELYCSNYNSTTFTVDLSRSRFMGMLIG